MKKYKKYDFPVSKIRRFLEPGPVVLVTSHHKGQTDIMAMGWHMVMEFQPSRIGCFITPANHSFELIRSSRECVINIPTYDMIDAVIGVGNTHGDQLDKFKEFGLTSTPASRVKAPVIAECYASYECKLVDDSLIAKYSLFIFEVEKAHVARAPRYPQTVHYRGDGVFMISGGNLDYRKQFKKENL